MLSGVLPTTIMLSKYIITSGMPCSRFSNVYWKIPWADETPNGGQLYTNIPLRVFIVTSFLESLCNRSCWKAWLMSSDVKHFPPPTI